MDSEARLAERAYDPSDAQAAHRALAALGRDGLGWKHLEVPTFELEAPHALHAGLIRWDCLPKPVFTLGRIRAWTERDAVLTAARKCRTAKRWLQVGAAWHWNCCMQPVSDLNVSGDSGWRGLFDATMALLVESLKKDGMLQPVDVDANLKVVNGFRRIEAAKIAGIGAVPTRLIRLIRRQT